MSEWLNSLSAWANTATLESWSKVFGIGGTVGGLVLFSFAYYQYRRSDRWKRTEFIANLYKQFADDVTCQQAVWMLDWDGREFTFGDENIVVTHDLLARALRLHSELKPSLPKAEFTIEEMYVRDTFDRFFSHLEQFERAISNRLISQKQVFPYFQYVVELLRGERHLSPAVQQSVKAYLLRYGYEDVQNFIDRFPPCGGLPKWRRWLARQGL